MIEIDLKNTQEEFYWKKIDMNLISPQMKEILNSLIINRINFIMFISKMSIIRAKIRPIIIKINIKIENNLFFVIKNISNI
jgi:hypothetical protein